MEDLANAQLVMVAPTVMTSDVVHSSTTASTDRLDIFWRAGRRQILRPSIL